MKRFNEVLRRHKGKLLFILFLGFLFLVFAGTEIVLRIKGYKPGIIGSPKYFSKVDSLVVSKDYTTDNYGNMILSENAIAFVSDFLRVEHSTLEINTMYSDRMREYTTKQAAREYSFLKNGEDDYKKDCAFCEYVMNLLSANTTDPYDQLLLKSLYEPINAQGYRSPAFEFIQTPRKKILLLGDSFTWGLSAKPMFNCFADILVARGYAVFNSGIVGADPAQYLSVTEKWMDTLKPDVVIVNFFMGNDQMHFLREARPDQPHYHVTNAGWLWSIPGGCWLDAHATYQNLLDEVTIPQQDSFAFNRWCAGTVLGTQLWQLLRRMNLAKGTIKSQRISCNQNYSEDPVTEIYLNRLQALCDSSGVPFIIGVIPDYKKKDAETRKEAGLNFGTLPWRIPDALTPADYNPDPDGHFNNSGHRKYADMLIGVLDSVFAGQAEKFR